MPEIESLSGLEILDSRGRPTVAACCKLKLGPEAWASVPSGASTGKAEAMELRDGDPRRYGGLGCRRAVENVNGPLARALIGGQFDNQRELDEALLALDGTQDKSRLGANAILAISIAFARAAAAAQGVELYQHFAHLIGGSPRQLPRLTVNLFSGGKHAGGQVRIQDVLLVPRSAMTIDESLAATYAVYQSAAKLCAQKYASRPLVADEGGLAPPFPNADAMLGDAVEAIHAAGLDPGRDVALAVDLASSHFYCDGRYRLDGVSLSPPQMIDRVIGWLDRYPIISLEDALAEDDWKHWPALRQAVGGRALVLGDDLLCTNPQRIARAIESNCADALLLKVNQIGTLTQAAQALAMARAAGWSVTISARSGETEDNWLADLAVGWSADHIKIGSITRSERLAKYNRLLAIEAQTHFPLA
ncbi:MAG TPA: enolase C-terminal domain-like protein [Tepidisphaeraceae bacterium]|nr:enolase C-terminal domain-like protein [Tepidisphaeraceae bacterium]